MCVGVNPDITGQNGNDFYDFLQTVPPPKIAQPTIKYNSTDHYCSAKTSIYRLKKIKS